jgi:hypothetical protein
MDRRSLWWNIGAFFLHLVCKLGACATAEPFLRGFFASGSNPPKALVAVRFDFLVFLASSFECCGTTPDFSAYLLCSLSLL